MRSFLPNPRAWGNRKGHIEGAGTPQRLGKGLQAVLSGLTVPSLWDTLAMKHIGPEFPVYVQTVGYWC